MDLTFKEIVDKLQSHEKDFEIGRDASLINENGELLFLYEYDEIRIKYPILEITELFEGSRSFNYQDDRWNGPCFPLFVAIESTILKKFRKNPKLKDKNVISILDALVRKPDIKSHNEFLCQLQNELRVNLSMNAFSKPEVIGSLKTVLKSVKNHHITGGIRGYLQFLEEFYSREM